MVKSKIAIGQMFAYFRKPICDDEMPMPSVFVKVANNTADGEEISLFVDNQALVRFSIDGSTHIAPYEKWYITDRYYDYNVKNGEFIPISDLNEMDDLCEKKGYPPYEIDL